MPSLLTRLRTAYGAHPVHLLSLLACFAVTGYVVTHLAGNPSLPRMLAWFGGALIAHDLIAFPIYTLGERATSRILARHDGSARVPLLNYLRVPAAASALLFVVFLPGIIRQGGTTYHAATGQTQRPFLLRWVLISAVLFGCSAVVFAVRYVRARNATPGHDPH
jgi:hypothetical protein